MTWDALRKSINGLVNKVRLQGNFALFAVQQSGPAVYGGVWQDCSCGVREPAWPVTCSSVAAAG